MSDCLYTIKNKSYVWVKIGYIALIIFTLGIILSAINLKFIWILIISLPFALVPFVSKYKWREVRFYFDRVENVGFFSYSIYYADIKAIQRGKKYIYIIEKDRERDLISRKRRVIRSGKYRVSDTYRHNISLHKYLYNTIMNIPNNDEIYDKIVEIVGEKKLENIERNNVTTSYLFTNYKNSKIGNYFLLLLASFLTSGFMLLILYVTTWKLEYRITSTQMIGFFIIVSLIMSLIYKKLFKIDENMHDYNFYEDYVSLVNLKTSNIDKNISYSNIFAINFETNNNIKRNNVSITIKYLLPDSLDIETIKFINCDKDFEEIMIGLIRKSKGIERK